MEGRCVTQRHSSILLEGHHHSYILKDDIAQCIDIYTVYVYL